MTIPLATRLEQFDEMDDGNRRVYIHRLKAKKSRYEKALKEMDFIFKRYDQLKAVRFTKRIKENMDSYSL